MKKIISMLLAVMMIATLTVTAFAAGEKGSITIEHPEANATYSIYKILDLESYNNTTKTYSYKIAAGWEDFFKAEGANYVNFVMDDNDTPDDTADDFATAYIAGWKIAADDEDYADSVKAFTEDALAYAQTKGITAITADGDTSGADVTVNNLDLGYYLIDTNMGTLCGLTTTKPTATVTQKHYLPALEKEVQENSAVNKTDSVDDLTEGWVSENDANINDTVYFKITVTAKAGAQDYVVHDAMSDGLTFKEIVSITHEKKSDSSVTDVADYTLSTTAHTHADDDDATDDITCDFSITFGQTFCDT
ncbi:MAG: isopeptide-forming domain-containing fimbrial protein, partial [Clostridia bacterium]|nr:isopeptide-forming domain-containing fimbrial protein [Clostridia bacterium]